MKYVFIIFIFICTCGAQAQDEVPGINDGVSTVQATVGINDSVSTVQATVGINDSVPAVQAAVGMVPSQDISGTAGTHAVEPYGIRSDAAFLVANDSLHLPVMNRYGSVGIGHYPLGWGGMYDWELHKGLNVNLGASVFAMFGKHAPGGAGFGQNLSAMYAVPLTDKLSFAAGGYINNVYWAHNSYRDAGVNAVLGYKFNDHWEAYLYGQKSLTDRRMPLPLYDMNNLGDRIGAAVRYNFNPSFSVQVSVSKGETDIPTCFPMHAAPRW